MRLSQAAPRSLVVGVDIGTTKVAVVVAEAQQDAPPRILGVGCVLHSGLARGEVVAMGAAVEAVQEAVRKAEQATGVTIRSAYVSLAGAHVRAQVKRGAVAVSRADREISAKDRERALDMARQALRPSLGEIIHELPLGFCVDGIDGITDPVGLSGYFLEAHVFFATGSEQAIQNVCRCAQKAGITVEGLVLDPLASAYAVLTKEEREAGVLLIDIGGGTSDIAMFFEGRLCYTGVVGIGGQNVTRDLAIGLRLKPTQAERIKQSFGPGVREQERIEEVVGARMEEIFYAVQNQIKTLKEIPLLGAGVVLTGGGSLLWGVTRWAEDILGMPTLCKQPADIDGLSNLPGATLSTGAGLVHYAATHGMEHQTSETSLWQWIKSQVRVIWRTLYSFPDRHTGIFAPLKK